MNRLRIAALLLLAAACAASARRVEDRAAAGVSADRLGAVIRELASDAYEGRAPGTAGERRTVEFLEKRMKELGLEPGAKDGRYVQRLPLVGITGRPRVSFRGPRGKLEPRFPDEYVAVSRADKPLVELKASEIVFVGYGVKATEYGWDDYKGTDLRGKTLLMLVNDPAVPDPADPARLDDSVFKGKAMTYYGRWTYKYEIASELGAAAAIIIHETGPAGYPYEVVSGSFGREQFDLRRADPPYRVPVESWVSSTTAQRLLRLGGRDLETLKAAAIRRDFKPVALGLTLDASVETTRRDVDSANVVGLLRGGDPKRSGEYVAYVAHWDHLGRDDSAAGDGIFNGAVDNATGVAALLEIAGAFRRLPRPPSRSILFIATGAEEKGLLGAEHYAAEPLFPLEKTLAVLNMDALNTYGRTKDQPMLGLELSTLREHAQAAAAIEGRALSGDPAPEKGSFFRSDHFPFAKRGVPALDLGSGIHVHGREPGWGKTRREEFTARDYHKPSDEVKPDWDLSGMEQDVRLFFRVGVSVAESSRWPEWLPGTEFKAARERALAGLR